MEMRRFLSVVFFLAAVGSAKAQQTIRVPADQSTIQAGIDAAKNGDTVLVAPGTYAESLDFKGKSITVTSGATNYAAATGTFLQQVGTQPVATFHTSETTAAVLNGFTISNGQQTMISVTSASPTISNNVFNNIAGCGVNIGGAGASPLISGNHFFAMQIGSSGCSPGGNGTAVNAFQAGDISIIGNVIEQSNAPSDNPTELINFDDCISALLQNNIIEANTEGGNFLFADVVGRLLLIQNAIFNNTEAGIGKNNKVGGLAPVEMAEPYIPYYAAKPSYILLLNNTIANNNEQIAGSTNTTIPQISFSGLQPGQLVPQVDTENNLIVSTRQGTAARCGFNSGQPTNYSYNDTFNAAPVVPPTTCATGSATANLTQDPQFIDLLGGNVQIAHSSPAVYAGNILAPMLPATDLAGKNRTVCGQVDMGAYQTHPIPPITLTSTPNPSVGGTSVTFEAFVQGNCNIPTGMLTFIDGKNPIGTVTLDSTGRASLSTSALLVGTHTITATYPGDFNFDPSTATPITQVVTGYPTQTTIQATPNPAQAFQTITLTATVSSQFGTPNGTVSFYAGSQLLVTATLLPNGTATAAVNSLGAGTYSLTAVYNPSLTYARSTSPALILVVNGTATTTTLSSTPNPSAYGQNVTLTATIKAATPNAVSSGTVVFTDGSTPLGPVQVSASGTAVFTTSSLTPGSHILTASFGGSPDFNPSTSNPVFQVVNPIVTTVSLSGSPNPAALGQAVTLSAFVTDPTGAPVASGSVLFADQFGNIGTASISGGSATLIVSTLSAGNHNITATYFGGGLYAGGVSKPLLEIIQTFDFTISLSFPTLTVASGAPATVTVQVQGVGNVAGNVALTAAQVPANGSVSFSPATVAFSASGTGTSLLTLTTALQPHASTLPIERTVWKQRTFLCMILMLPAAFKRRRSWRTLCFSLLGLLPLVAILGCTNIRYPLSRVAPGTYVIPVTGVDSTSKISHTVNLVVTVD